MPQAPNVGQENEVGIARQAKVEQILDHLIGAGRGHRGLSYKPPQDLYNFQVQKVRSVKGLAAGVDPALDFLSYGGLKKPVYGGGGVEDDHRESRSSRTRRAVSN